MFGKILSKLILKAYQNRDMQIEKIKNRTFIRANDTTGCNTYLLAGTYSYNEVIFLNELTTYSCGFGYCKELGPIAFIGIPNPIKAKRSGYFEYNVSDYGRPSCRDEYYFNSYTDEEAKNIRNYTVYGLDGIEEVAKEAPIKDLNYIYDTRYKAKEIKEPRILDMDCKLQGEYTYNEAKILATGSLKQKEGYCGEEHPIVFATVDGNYNVGIINMWEDDIGFVRGFRDVFEYGMEEPKTQKIEFLSEKEAKDIDKFILYVYNYACSGIGKNKYEVEKHDRTLDGRFNFLQPDGSDYRLIEHREMFIN